MHSHWTYQQLCPPEVLQTPWMKGLLLNILDKVNVHLLSPTIGSTLWEKEVSVAKERSPLDAYLTFA